MCLKSNLIWLCLFLGCVQSPEIKPQPSPQVPTQLKTHTTDEELIKRHLVKWNGQSVELVNANKVRDYSDEKGKNVVQYIVLYKRHTYARPETDLVTIIDHQLAPEPTEPMEQTLQQWANPPPTPKPQPAQIIIKRPHGYEIQELPPQE